MQPTRRRLLQVGLGGAAVLALAGTGLALQPTRFREPRVPLEALDLRSFSILAAIADRACPGSDGLPDAWTLQVPERVDAAVARFHPGARAELAQVLGLWESGLAGLVLDGRPRAFSQCSAETRDRVLEAWRTSRLPLRRSAYKAVVGLITAAYWSHPATFAHVGYPGPPRFPEQRGWAG